MNVLFQWVDGGILRQFQLQKKTDRYRILMAVVNEVQQSIANEGQPGQNATNGGVEAPVEALRDSIPAETPAQESPAAQPTPQPTSSACTVRFPTRDHNAQCDNCKTHIYGIRFKCCVCDNYDLCFKCETNGAHSGHIMLRFAKVAKQTFSWAKVGKQLNKALCKFQTLTFPDGHATADDPYKSDQKHDVNCQECGKKIVGVRFKCALCQEFDLCSACEAKGCHDQHTMLRFSSVANDVNSWKQMEPRIGKQLHYELKRLQVRINDNKKKKSGQTRITTADIDRTMAAALNGTRSTPQTPSAPRRGPTVLCGTSLLRTKALKRNARSVSKKNCGSKSKMARKEDVNKECEVRCGVAAKHGNAVPAVNGDYPAPEAAPPQARADSTPTRNGGSGAVKIEYTTGGENKTHVREALNTVMPNGIRLAKAEATEKD